MKSYFLFISLSILIQGSLIAQGKELIAKSEFYAAEEAYNVGDYQNCLVNLQKSEDANGNTPLIQYLRVKSFFNLEEYSKADSSLNTFFAITPKDLENEPQYVEMVSLISKIDEKKKEIETEILKRKEKMKAHLISAKQYITSGDTYNANIQIYSFWSLWADENYPQVPLNEFNDARSSFFNEATAANLFIDNLSGITRRTKTIGTQTWMTENMISIFQGQASEPNNSSYDKWKMGALYTWEQAKKACPTGWRLPDDKDIEQLVYHLMGKKLVLDEIPKRIGGSKKDYKTLSFRLIEGPFDAQMFPIANYIYDLPTNENSDISNIKLSMFWINDQNTSQSKIYSFMIFNEYPYAQKAYTTNGNELRSIRCIKE